MRFVREITDRRPVLSGWVIVLLYTVLPLAVMVLCKMVAGDAFNIELIVLIYAFILQLILWRSVERFILVMLPFILMLLGLILGEIGATIAQGLPQTYELGGALGYLAASALIDLCGTEVCGILGALLVNALINLARFIWENVTDR